MATAIYNPPGFRGSLESGYCLSAGLDVESITVLVNGSTEGPVSRVIWINIYSGHYFSSSCLL